MTPSLASNDSVSSIGPYALRRCLGEGGDGQVYEAWDELLHRHVALKCLAIGGGQAGSERLIREARLAASLHHPAFVKIYGFEDDGRAQFIVMELVRGDTLRGAAADCTAEPSRALDIADQVAAAMAEAHAAGLVHGDLKPGNLMLEPGGAVRILDFGLARHIDPLATQTGVPEDPQGTIAYMAPERLAGRPPSAATDIYALGVVLYQLVNGERPYAALHGLALASAHMHTSSHQWQYPDRLDPGILQLILAMTARDPAARLPDMEAVRARIAQLRDAPFGLAAPAAADSPIASASAPPPPLRRGKRGLKLAPLLGAGVLAAAAVTAVLVKPPAWLAPVAPYSESASMQAGMEALRHVDRDGQVERALSSFDAILAHGPKHAAAAAGQSLAYSMRYSGDGRDEAWLMRAASAAALAVQADDQLALAHTAQSWVAALQGHGAAALAAADRALALDPSDTFALGAKINVLLRMQRRDEAAALIEQARTRWPKERAFTDLEGTLLYQRGDYAGAELAFRRSLALEPDAVLPYASLSAALQRQARGDEALAVLQQGLRVQPSGALYSNLGTVLYNRGDFTGAGAAFEHAVSAAKGAPNDYLKWANLADALRWIPGREQAAHDAYRRAMQLLDPILARAPDDPTFLSRMGLYAAHLGDEPRALEWTERGAAAAPDNPDVRFRAALANELSGRRSAALGHLARAIAFGYPFSSIESEPELVALRRDARYQTLAMEHKR
jgi:serine/threonine-protein kinase